MTVPTLHGVYFDGSKRAGYWKAILTIPGRIQHIPLPDTDQYTSRADAEAQAAATKWVAR